MTPLMSTDGWVTLGIFFIIVCGGGIAAFFSDLGQAIVSRTHGGAGKLGKSERRELNSLRIENGQLKEVLREVQAYDKFAATPLTTELSEKVNRALAPKEIQK